MSQSESRRVAHCMYVEIELKKKKRKKKKEILILKVWFYGNSVKLRQSPTHDTHTHTRREQTHNSWERREVEVARETGEGGGEREAIKLTLNSCVLHLKEGCICTKLTISTCVSTLKYTRHTKHSQYSRWLYLSSHML